MTTIAWDRAQVTVKLAGKARMLGRGYPRKRRGIERLWISDFAGTAERGWEKNCRRNHGG